MSNTLLGVRSKAELADDSHARNIDGREVLLVTKARSIQGNGTKSVLVSRRNHQVSSLLRCSWDSEASSTGVFDVPSGKDDGDGIQACPID